LVGGLLYLNDSREVMLSPILVFFCVLM